MHDNENSRAWLRITAREPDMVSSTVQQVSPHVVMNSALNLRISSASKDELTG